MFEELKPCPFCGGEAYLFVNDGVRVICPRCGVSSKCLVDSMGANNKPTLNATKAVIEAWNKRASKESYTRGKWDVRENISSPIFRYWQCSICGYTQSNTDNYNYCPKCGAKMGGE